MFVGIVTSITVEEQPVKGIGYPASMRRVVFNVRETLSGEPSTETEVLTGMGAGDCGFPFRVGQGYLVYANPWHGQLTTGVCSRTRLLIEAEEDLNYIHSLATAPPGATLSGSIVRLLQPAQGTRAQEPLAGIKVRVAAEEGPTFTAVTNTDGKFSVAGLKPGKYSIKPEFPGSLIVRDIRGDRSVVLTSRGCAVEDFYAVLNGRVSGRAVNADGTAAMNVPLLLEPVDGWKTNPFFNYSPAETDADGHFEFKGLAPGEYVLGVTLLNPPDERAPYPKTFYPGVKSFDAAARLRIGEAEELENLDFHLPSKLIATRLAIEVIGPDGKPGIRATVAVNDKEFTGPPWVGHADSQGRAETSVLEGRTYSAQVSMSASGSQPACLGQTDLTVEPNPKPIRIRVNCEGRKK